MDFEGMQFTFEARDARVKNCRYGESAKKKKARILKTFKETRGRKPNRVRQG